LASECPRPQRAGQFDGRAMMAGTTHHKVLIVGGGTAGITVAASLKRHGPGGIDIAIVEPSDTHYYQPALTLVGAGLYDLARTHRPTDPASASPVTDNSSSIPIQRGNQMR
jgi:NADPH-dependent 2,4-dienoyl-CoA reductase/sulfur reductase-like enzyme